MINKKEFENICNLLIENVDKEIKLQEAIMEYSGEYCVITNVCSIAVVTLKYVLMCCGLEEKYATEESSWFAVETDFGRKRVVDEKNKSHCYTIKIDNKTYAIGCVGDFYNYIKAVYDN